MIDLRGGPIIVAALISGCCAGTLLAGVPPAGFQETPVVTGLPEVTAFEWAHNGDLWILDKGGQVRLEHAGTAQLITALTINVDSTGERGLLGMAFDPHEPARP